MKRLGMFIFATLAAVVVATSSASAVEVSMFGKTKSGEEVHEYVLKNDCGMTVSLISRGATIRQIIVPDRDGKAADVVNGFDDVAGYEGEGNQYFGNATGRVCNRIAKGKLRGPLDGKVLAGHQQRSEPPARRCRTQPRQGRLEGEATHSKRKPAKVSHSLCQSGWRRKDIPAELTIGIRYVPAEG